MKIDVSGAITREEAKKLILEKWVPKKEKELVDLKDSIGRVTFEDIYSINTLPVLRSSMMDGIAVKSSDFFIGLPETSNWVKGVDYVRADTGDDFPDDFDAIIPIEKVTFNEEKIVLSSDVIVEKGSFIDKSGSIVEKGQLLIKKDTRIKPIHLAILGTGGVEKIPVIKKPKIVYIPTGSELVELFKKPSRGENIQSNGIMIDTMLTELGAVTYHYPIVEDNINQIESSLEKALDEADIVLINGGSSKGEEDLGINLLKKREILLQHSVLIGPGMPVGIGFEKNIPIINVPGPTLGAFYIVDWLVSFLVNRYLNQPREVREKIEVTLLNEFYVPGVFEFFVRLEVFKTDEGYKAKALSWDGGMPKMVSNANAIFIAPIGLNRYEKDLKINVELLYGRSHIEKL